MTSALTTFNFGPAAQPLRTIKIDGEPWFVAKDVCDALTLRVDNSVRSLDDDEKANTQLQGFARGATIVSESGLYALVLKSRKPAARDFRKWVTSVVLPAIRKDGAYVMGEEKVKTGEMSMEEMTLKVMAALTDKVGRLAL